MAFLRKAGCIDQQKMSSGLGKKEKKSSLQEWLHEHPGLER